MNKDFLLQNTGNFFRFPFGNFMGLFPTTVKNLGQEIPCMGKYWEVDASHDYTNGFFLGKRFHFTMYPRTGKSCECLPMLFPILEISWGLYSHVVHTIVNNMGILPLVVSIFGVR